MKQKSNWLLLAFVMLVLVAEIIPRTLGNLDEIWNFNFIRNVADGLLPYKDFNMVQMPFFPLSLSIFFSIFGTELIVMRILGILLCTGIVFIVYKILNLLIKNKYISCTFAILILYLYKEYFCLDYNFIVLAITLIILYFELKNKKELLEKNVKNDILLGILAGTAITFKQSTGLVLVAIFVAYKWLFIRDKKDLIMAFKISLIRGFSALIPVIIMLIYLCANQLFTQFFDYCILGIKTFDNHVSYTSLWSSSNIVIKALCVIVPIVILYCIYYILRNKNDSKNILILLAYSISASIVIYPIADEMHFLIGALPGIITLIYIIWKEISEVSKEIKIKEIIKREIVKISKCILLATLAVLALLSLNTITKWIKEYTPSNIEHYKHIDVEDIRGRIEVEMEYIQEKQNQGKKVYILDADAPITMIPLNRYNKNYDMLLKGNLGKDGANGVIEQIKEEQNALFLVRKTERGLNWQFPKDVLYYVKNNMNKIDEISVYEVYESNI